MFSLEDIVQEAQNGQALGNIARQHGISEDQVRKAADALIPAFSAGLAQKTDSAGGLADLFGAVLNDRYRDAFEGSAGLDDAETINDGNELVGKLFSANDAPDVLAAHAAQASGLAPGLIRMLMPVILSMVVGGLFKKMQGGGLGDLLDQMGKMGGKSPGNSSGGLGDILGDILGKGSLGGGQPPQPRPAPQPRQTPGPAGGLGGLLGGLLGSILGGGKATGQQRGQGQQRADQIFPEGFDPDTLNNGLDQLGKILRPDASAQGQQRPGAAPPGLEDLLGQILGHR